MATDPQTADSAETDRHEPSPLGELTGFQRDLLVAIERLDAPHGLGIKDYLGQFYADELHHGRLYPNLDGLVGRGLLRKSKKDRRTNEYRLSDRGQQALDTHREWMDNGDV